MREIKFRAWDVINKNMLFGNDILMKHTANGYVSENWKHQEYTGKNDILMQYIGLKDRNGIEIYEGDYLVLNKLNKSVYTVCYSGNKFILDGVSIFDNEHYFTEREIIGNIYEDSVLLND